MVYADDVTHVLTEERASRLSAALRRAGTAHGGHSRRGRLHRNWPCRRSGTDRTALREAGIVKTPEDLGIDRRRANRQMLAAKAFAIWLTGLARTL
ncbi:malonate decarboxylase subunit alpha [Klebsiella pneumoniae subsp. pneumoniae]|nr:malonate decarboxylase subunit alpha [Klebsiella pneumoniae subsp. pneumoniae]